MNQMKNLFIAYGKFLKTSKPVNELFVLLTTGLLGLALKETTGKTKYLSYISAICNFGLIIPFWMLA